MITLREVKMEKNDEKDALFKSVQRLSAETKEEIDGSTFITVGDALITGSTITIIDNLPRDDKNIIRDFILA